MESGSKKLWFKAKNFGWGWYPISWEGWLVTVLFIVLLILHPLLSFSTTEEPTPVELSLFFVRTVIFVALLIFVCYRRGEKPQWRWGRPKEEEELFKVYTKEGVETGKIATKTEVHQKGLWHKTVHIWIVTPEKKILMQKRARTKAQDAYKWANHGGHLGVEESSLSGVLREVQEEIGILLDEKHVQSLGVYPHSGAFKNGTFIENELTELFIAEQSISLDTLTLDANEVEQVRLFTLSELAVGKAPDGDLIVLKPEEYQLLLAYLSGEQYGAA